MTPPTPESPRGRIAIRLEDTDVAALLRASLGPLATQAARERIELRVVTLGAPQTVVVDREKIAWSVATLVGNALRYVKRSERTVDPSGSVLVQVEYDDASPHVVTIAIQDDGPGILDDKLPYLFDRRRGALHADGLVLTLVREVITAHDGEIRVETRRGADEHGSSITLHLPSGSP